MKYLYILTLIFPLIINSQEKLKYDTDSQSIEFEISKNQYYISYKPNKKATINKQIGSKSMTPIIENSTLITSNESSLSFKNGKSKILEDFDYQIEKVEPILIYKDGIKQVCNEELIIQISNQSYLKKLFKDFEYTFIKDEYSDNQFLVKIKGINTHQLFELTNRLNQDKNVVFAEPNFIRFMKPHTNDQFFSSQWSINNQGYLGGTIDADMDVEEAWAHSTGSGIKVAVIDEGVDLTHPDLNANLLAGFDATDGNLNGAPNEANIDAHGTACAGIIAGVANNTVGVAGVAYNAKIIPVRIGYSNGLPLADPNRTWITNNSWIANGINWAVQNGADILSNSWGGGSPSSAVTNAINNAVNNGRSNHKGCIVLFSTGNLDTNVSYPATLNNVIAVGASSMCDERKSPTSCDGEFWWGSNFGNEIDVVAPGVEIFTTDISGVNGYSNGDYDSNFNGTSSACPNAAGVAALVLSINPNFTQTQVREILETTTDKIGNTPYANMFKYGSLQTWNDEVGFGRLNAYEAVQKAINYDNYYSHYITGPTQITPGTGGFYKITNPYAYATNYVWNIPSGCTYNYCWEIVQGQGTSAALIHGGSTGLYDITCTIYNGSTQIGNYYITVNVQNPYNGGGGGDPCDGEINVLPTVIYPPEPCDNELMGVHNNQERIYFKKVFVFNMLGQIVVETNEKQEVDISHLNSGIYIIKAELSNNEIMTKKILKE